MTTNTGYGGGVTLAASVPKQTRLEALGQQINDVAKGLEEALTRLGGVANRLDGSEPGQEGSGKTPPQAVPNGFVSDLQDRLRYVGALVERLHAEASRLERL